MSSATTYVAFNPRQCASVRMRRITIRKNIILDNLRKVGALHLQAECKAVVHAKQKAVYTAYNLTCNFTATISKSFWICLQMDYEP